MLEMHFGVQHVREDEVREGPLVEGEVSNGGEGERAEDFDVLKADPVKDGRFEGCEVG